MNPLIIQLFAVFGPIVNTIIQRYMASHSGALPTDAEVLQEFQMNLEQYLAEGNAWLIAHPRDAAR